MIRNNNVLRLATLAAFASLAAQGEVAQERNISFVACPIIQDTNTVPCWLAEYEGKLYFLGIQTDAGGWPPPWQGHKVLVEGQVTDNPLVCGGIVLKSDVGNRAGVDISGAPLEATTCTAPPTREPDRRRPQI